jgi:hypothetical protein
MPMVPGASERFPDLLQFFGGYLHQDWDMDYPDVDAAIDAAIVESPDRLVLVAHQLDELLAAVSTEDEAETAVNELTGWGYYPPGNGRTWRGWLAEVRARLD